MTLAAQLHNADSAFCRHLNASDRKDSRASREERDPSRRKRSRTPDRSRGPPRDEPRDSERRNRDRYPRSDLHHHILLSVLIEHAENCHVCKARSQVSVNGKAKQAPVRRGTLRCSLDSI